MAVPAQLQAERDRQRAVLLGGLESRNLHLFTAETEKLDAWPDDQRAGLEQHIKDLDRSIKEAPRAARRPPPWPTSCKAQREQRDLEAQRDKRQRELFARQDEVQQQRDRIVVGRRTTIAARP